MDNLLLKKLQIKSGFNVNLINAPEHATSIFGEIPNDVNFTFQLNAVYNAILIFATNKAELIHSLDETKGKITVDTICWIFYPKSKSAIASDLNLMSNWKDLVSYQLEPCASAAVNETWTGLRIKPAGTTKKSGIANEDISKNDYGKYVDVANKIITLPEDLKRALEKHPMALANFEKLAYSHKKEYVLWILQAKQEKTKVDRMNKMVEKLLQGKKNPGEK